jgi:hypothetical protein
LLILDLTVQGIDFLLRKFSPVPICSRLFPTFSSISFSVSGFMWSSLIHLDLRFVHRNNNGSIHILLHDSYQENQHNLLKMLSFFHWMILAPLSKSSDHMCVASFLCLPFYSIDLPGFCCTITMQFLS